MSIQFWKLKPANLLHICLKTVSHSHFVWATHWPITVVINPNFELLKYLLTLCCSPHYCICLRHLSVCLCVHPWETIKVCARSFIVQKTFKSWCQWCTDWTFSLDTSVHSNWNQCSSSRNADFQCDIEKDSTFDKWCHVFLIKSIFAVVLLSLYL